MAQPNKNVWGPVLWKLLHTAAECLGNQSIPVLKQDEPRQWINLLVATEHLMPCLMCKKHYREWRIKRSVEVFRYMEGAALREAARRWLWELHRDICVQNGVFSIEYDELDKVYSDRTPAFFKTQLADLRLKIGGGEQFRLFQRCFIIFLKIVNKY